MTKKLITAVLCASIIFSNTALATEELFSDIDNNNTNLTSTLKNLQKFGIVEGYEDGSFKPENNITRAEFAVMTRRIMNPDNLISDVGVYNLSESIDGLVPWHFAVTEINLLKKMRIISGYEDGSLKPNQNITYCEGIKMLVCALGYKDMAIKKGGWSDGYIECAKELGLLTNIEEENYAKYATRAASAIMVNNALSIPRNFASVCDVGESVADTPEGVYRVDGAVSETVHGMTFEEMLNGIHTEYASIVNDNIVEQELPSDISVAGKYFSQVFYGGGLPEFINYNDNQKIYIDEEVGSITIYFEKVNKSCDYYITLNSLYDTKYYRMPSKEEFEQNSMIFADLCPPNVHFVGPISTEKFTFSNIPRGAYRLDVYSMPCLSEVSGAVVVEGETIN